jgi:hypothetical protein
MADLRCGVWITTPGHLQRFRDIYDRTSLFHRLRGDYSLPTGFPRFKIWQPDRAPREIPLAILSVGDLTLSSESLSYSYNPKPRYADLLDLSFSAPIRGLEIALAQFDYAPMRHFNLPYISLRVRKLEIDPVLVSASGPGPFALLIRRRTKRLFDEMVRAGATALPSNNRWRGP